MRETHKFSSVIGGRRIMRKVVCGGETVEPTTEVHRYYDKRRCCVLSEPPEEEGALNWLLAAPAGWRPFGVVWLGQSYAENLFYKQRYAKDRKVMINSYVSLGAGVRTPKFYGEAFFYKEKGYGLFGHPFRSYLLYDTIFGNVLVEAESVDRDQSVYRYGKHPPLAAKPVNQFGGHLVVSNDIDFLAGAVDAEVDKMFERLLQ